MRALLFAAAALLAVPAGAQDHSGHGAHGGHDAPEPSPEARGHDHSAHGAVDHSQMDHAGMGHDPAPPTASGPPPRAFEGPAHAADAIFGAGAMAPARAALAHESGGMTFGLAMIERLEARIGEGRDGWLWDAQAWYGGDIDRLWLKSEGDADFDGDVGHAEVQALWSHAIGPWFDLQTGVRYDIEPRSRAHAVIGVQGLAPYMFEVDAAAFLSDKGDLTVKAEVEYDQRLTQRLILQPRAEVALAAQDVPELGLGSGIASIELGARLRYEFAREFAPYLGVAYETKLGRTADIARAEGDDPGRFVLLLGLRTWF